MKKRRMVPVVAVGGLFAFLFSLIFSFNMGDGSSEADVENETASTPIEEPVIDDVEVSGQSVVSAAVEPSVLEDAKLWLIDVLIDGRDYSVQRVTDAESSTSQARVPMTVDEIVDAAQRAEGDASGTLVRISRTPEAIAAAEKELASALQEAGIATDAVETRQRLVE
ncbi:MAG: hypothetical protein AAF989_09685 [Planctomycetota bacterium]